MADGILSRYGFHGHGPHGSDQAVAPISPTGGSVISHLQGATGDGEVDVLLVIGAVDVNLKIMALRSSGHLSRHSIKLRSGFALHRLPYPQLGLFILLSGADEPGDHGHGHHQGEMAAPAHGHELDVLSRPPDLPDNILQIQNQLLGLAQWGISHSDGGVIGPPADEAGKLRSPLLQARLHPETMQI